MKQVTLALTLCVLTLCAAPLFGQDRLAMQEHLIQQEGFVNTCYRDEFGNRSIGIGHKLASNEPITHLASETIILLFNQDLDRAIVDARRFGHDDIGRFDNKPEAVKEVMVYLAFNLGYAGLSQFTKMQTALANGDYHLAANELRNSLYAKQLPKRAALYAAMLDAAQ